jgi:hypothetical protein
MLQFRTGLYLYMSYSIGLPAAVFGTIYSFSLKYAGMSQDQL